MKLRVSELFESVQGEGEWLGVPSVFLRLSGCNLRCTWCDTPYASWHPEGPVVHLDELKRQIAQFSPRHLVLTGGEPMIFEPIIPLTEWLKAEGYTITIETAGTAYLAPKCDLMSISPKLSHSDPEDPAWRERHILTRQDLSALKWLMSEYRFQLKFVVRGEFAEADLAEIDALLGELPPCRPEQVFLMPEGTDRDTLRASLLQLMPHVMERGFRLAPRLHIDLFGNTKGT